VKTLLAILITLFVPLSAQAVIFEFDFDFGYDKQIYGSNRENSIVSRTYSSGISTYLFDLTAIDINASRTLEINTQNERYPVTGYTVDVVGDQSKLTTDVYGIGIKQMLAGRNAFMVPVISIGYAKQFLEISREVTFEDTITKSRFNGN